MQKVVIIGSGASGLISAIYAAKNNNQVIILERNNNCGKKLLLTGNGKCNYWNTDQDLKHYHTQNPLILNKIITKTNQQEILTFFDHIGIIPRIKNGLYYPYSNQSVSICYALLLEAELLGIKIINNFLVDKIIVKNKQFIIKSNQEEIIADKLIIATGSKANPKTGSDGNGYELVKSLNHSIIKPLPALVSLKGEESYFKKWKGIRTDVTLSLYHNENKIKEESGEIQLTDYGISGICVFNLSNVVTKLLDQKQNVKIKIDFLPYLKLSIEDLISFIDKRNQMLKKRNIGELFDSLLNYKLVNILLTESKINPKKSWNDLNNKQKKLVSQNLKQFSLKITDTNSFEKAQVCSGGVPLTEINYQTMESLKVKGLYIVGELLDVVGDCGGYNLSFAWISGMLAGKAISDN